MKPWCASTDGDVFWRQPPPTVEFIIQNAEPFNHAGAWWDRFGPAPVARPVAPISYNFGIFGGMRHAEIAEACGVVTDFLYQHRAFLAGTRCLRNLPMLVEQVWVPEILRVRHGIEPTELLRAEHLSSDAREINYYHAMGAKGSPVAADKVRARYAEVFGGVEGETAVKGL